MFSKEESTLLLLTETQHAQICITSMLPQIWLRGVCLRLPPSHQKLQSSSVLWSQRSADRQNWKRSVNFPRGKKMLE